MSIDPVVAARATGSIRSAVDAELPPEAWPRIAELVQAIDRALDLGDGATVARLTAELDAVRGVAPPSPLSASASTHPAPPSAAPPPSAGRRSSVSRRRRLPVLLAAVVVAVVVGGLASALGGGSGDDDAGDDGFERPDAGAGEDPEGEQTTTTEGDASEETTTTVESEEVPTTDPGEVPEPLVDVGVLDLGSSGVLAIDLSWTSGADLDLRVVEPDGTELDLNDDEDPSDSGAEHSGDTPADCGAASSLRTESVRWPTGGAQAGEYQVVVVGFEVDGCGDGTFTVAADTGADQLAVEQSVISAQSRTFRFLADADPAPPTTAPPTTDADVVGPTDDTSDRDADVLGDRGDDDEDTVGVAAIVVLTAAAGGLVAWAAGRRRLPLDVVAAVPAAVAHLARPRLPVPTELRELANHTIHRLEVGPS